MSANDEKKAIDAIRELASYKLSKSEIPKRVGNKIKTKLKQLGIDPESAAKTSAIAKLLDDIYSKKARYKLGNFNIEGKVSPDEKMIRLGWKKDF